MPMKLDKALVKAIFQDISDGQAEARAEKEAAYIGALLRTYRKGGAARILNVGCGLGRHDRGLRRLGHTVDSVDISPEFVRMAKSRNRGFERFYRVGSMTSLPYEECTFDAVLCLFSTFNIPRDPQNANALKEFHRVLKRGGLLIMDLQTKSKTAGSRSIAVGNGIVKTVESKIVGNYLVGKETVLKEGKDGLSDVAHGVSRERLYSRAELASLCRKNGFGALRFYRAYTRRKLRAEDAQMLVVAKKC